MLVDNNDAIEYLQQFVTENKAKGMVAEYQLHPELAFSSNKIPALINGAWLISPKVAQAYRYRYAVFALPEIYSSQDALRQALKDWMYQAYGLSSYRYLEHQAFGVLIAGAVSRQSDIGNLEWVFASIKDEVPTLVSSPFELWPGTRGRPSKGEKWSQRTIERYQNIPPVYLTSMVLKQALFYGYIKQTLRRPLYDPYDVDGFIIGEGNRILPIEIKEKSITPQGQFGVDVGRILMLLRFCLAADTNALYFVREVDETPDRNLKMWRYVLLSDIIAAAQWNAQGGGASMTGGGTQTIMLEGDLFNTLNISTLKDCLDNYSSLSGSVRRSLTHFRDDINRYISG